MKTTQKLKLYLAGVLTTVLLFCLIGTAYAYVGRATREVEYRDIKVSLDGQTLDLRNAKGDRVEPFMIDGTNYLPVRALAEALGLNVRWDSPSSTIVLTTPKAEGGSPQFIAEENAAQSAKPSQTQTQSGGIGKEKAKSIALSHAGLTEADVTRLKVELDTERGRRVYEVDFYSGRTEYDYDIDAATGEILKYQTDND